MNMSIDILNGKVRVYNYELSPVGFPSQHIQQGVFIRGREDGEDSVVERVALDDIEIENSKSDLFKVGRLRFHPDEEDEIYKKLGIEDRENIYSDKELIDFLLDDSIETIRKISTLKSITLITRMKSMLFRMERSNKVPPVRVSSAVSERASELISGGKKNPNSQINKILEAEKNAQEEKNTKELLNELKMEVETLRKEKEEEAKAKDDIIERSQSAIEDLLKKVESLTKQTESANKGKNESAKDTTEKKQSVKGKTSKGTKPAKKG